MGVEFFFFQFRVLVARRRRKQRHRQRRPPPPRCRLSNHVPALFRSSTSSHLAAGHSQHRLAAIEREIGTGVVRGFRWSWRHLILFSWLDGGRRKKEKTSVSESFLFSFFSSSSLPHLFRGSKPKWFFFLFSPKSLPLYARRENSKASLAFQGEASAAVPFLASTALLLFFCGDKREVQIFFSSTSFQLGRMKKLRKPSGCKLFSLRFSSLESLAHFFFFRSTFSSAGACLFFHLSILIDLADAIRERSPVTLPRRKLLRCAREELKCANGSHRVN